MALAIALIIDGELMKAAEPRTVSCLWLGHKHGTVRATELTNDHVVLPAQRLRVLTHEKGSEIKLHKQIKHCRI